MSRQCHETGQAQSTHENRHIFDCFNILKMLKAFFLATNMQHNSILQDNPKLGTEKHPMTQQCHETGQAQSTHENRDIFDCLNILNMLKAYFLPTNMQHNSILQDNPKLGTENRKTSNVPAMS